MNRLGGILWARQIMIVGSPTLAKNQADIYEREGSLDTQSSAQGQFRANLEQCGEFGDDIAFATDAYGLVTLDPALKVNQTRDAANAKLGRNSRSLVNVDFCDRKFADIFSCDFVNHWAKHATRSAPWSPEINEHRSRSGFNEVCEIGIIEFDQIRICHRKKCGELGWDSRN